MAVVNSFLYKHISSSESADCIILTKFTNIWIGLPDRIRARDPYIFVFFAVRFYFDLQKDLISTWNTWILTQLIVILSFSANVLIPVFLSFERIIRLIFKGMILIIFGPAASLIAILRFFSVASRQDLQKKIILTYV